MKPELSRRPSRHDLRELLFLYLKLGTIAFGGPAAHIAMMEDEVVRRRGWLSREDFLDLLGATNLIPGPNSTEMAIHIGRLRAGWRGLVLAGCAFILPAALLASLCGWAYVRFGSLPEAARILYGIKPVIVAVVLQALCGLARTALKTKVLLCIGAVVVVLSLMKVSLFGLLIGSAAAAVALRRAPRPGLLRDGGGLLLGGVLGGSPLAAGAAGAAPLLGILWIFVKVGAVLYGSGYVLLAFLQEELVEKAHWVTQGQLLDAIAVGQLTPGPVFTTATFLGYLLAGPAGAVVATVGIFLPAFVYVALSGAVIPKIRSSPVARDALDGVNAASWALMAAVTLPLARDALVDGPTVVLMLGSAVLLIRYRLNSVWIILMGAVAGWALDR